MLGRALVSLQPGKPQGLRLFDPPRQVNGRLPPLYATAAGADVDFDQALEPRAVPGDGGRKVIDVSGIIDADQNARLGGKPRQAVDLYRVDHLV